MGSCPWGPVAVVFRVDQGGSPILGQPPSRTGKDSVLKISKNSPQYLDLGVISEEKNYLFPRGKLRKIAKVSCERLYIAMSTPFLELQHKYRPLCAQTNVFPRAGLKPNGVQEVLAASLPFSRIAIYSSTSTQNEPIFRMFVTRCEVHSTAVKRGN